MTQPFAEALAWVPKSRALGATLGRAHDLARAQSHPAVTLEHLLQSLVEDPDASAVLLSCNIDLLHLNDAITAIVRQQPAAPDVEMPEASQPLVTILEYAVAAAQQSKRAEINGAIVLAAVVGEGKSEAAKQLIAAGMKFEDAVLALRRASAAKPAAADAAPAQSAPPALPAAQDQPPPPPPTPLAASGVVQSTTEPPAAVTTPSAPPAAHTRAAPSQHEFDDDPVTTARRRIAAIRSGQALPPLGAPSSPVQHPSTAAAHSTGASDWAPPPLPQTNGSAARPPRMPPPVPPVAGAPIRSNGAAPEHAANARAPWADAAAAESHAGPLPPRNAAHGNPIDPAHLIDRIPARMQSRVSTTIEMRIPRSAVLATAAALGGTPANGRDTTVTRALAIRLRAPSGGFHVENASPETHWFDSRGPHRDEEEVRWRWLVTPHGPGRRPLQLSIAMRTIAADGMIVETMLPEYQATVGISLNYASGMRQAMAWIIAAATGVALTILATGGWGLLFGRISG